jgi:hypothetical protein
MAVHKVVLGTALMALVAGPASALDVAAVQPGVEQPPTSSVPMFRLWQSPWMGSSVSRLLSLPSGGMAGVDDGQFSRNRLRRAIVLPRR